MPALQTQVEEDVHPIMANAIDVANSIMELTKKGYPAGAIFYGIAIFLAVGFRSNPQWDVDELMEQLWDQVDEEINDPHLMSGADVAH